MHGALFLDRDGVINVEKNYVWRTQDFEFLPGIFDLCRTALRCGLTPIVITNQAGIGRGYYSESDFQRLTAWMLDRFRDHGVRIGRVYHCPFHPTEGIGEFRRESYDRKPNPGMILHAQADFGFDLSRSVLVGDKESDIEAGRAAGVRYNLKLVPEPAPGQEPGDLEFPNLRAIDEWLGRTAVALTGEWPRRR